MLHEDYLLRLIHRFLQVLLAAREARREARRADARALLDEEARRLTGLTLPMLRRLHGRALDPVIAPDGALDPAKTVPVALLLAESATLAELDGDEAAADRLRERALGLWARLWRALEDGTAASPLELPGELLAEVRALAASVRLARLARPDRRALVGLLAEAGDVEAVEDELFALVDEGLLDRAAAEGVFARLTAAAPDRAAEVAALRAELAGRST
jgi:hypothetical protein